MKRVLTAALLSTGLAFAAAPVSAAESPVFGAAKVQKLGSKQMQSVVGQGFYSSYYAYYGNYSANVAAQWGSYGQYYELWGSGYRNTTYNAYNQAAAWAADAYSYYIAARNCVYSCS